MKIAHVGAISTGAVIAVGLAMILPAFSQHNSSGLDHTKSKPVPVLLSFEVLETSKTIDDVGQWCKDLALVLEEHQVPVVVFLSGKVAQNHPECITSFPSRVDIGSQTYSYVDLERVGDYTKALEEVKKGKLAIDQVGKLDSKVFKAPYGSTDDNIYSLLSRSNISADFSYKEQYNKFENGMFIRYDLISYDETEKDNLANIVETITSGTSVVPITFDLDNSISVDEIDVLIEELKSQYGNKINFVNASDLTGSDLSIRTGVNDQ
jgi:hypothetical protein